MTEIDKDYEFMLHYLEMVLLYSDKTHYMYTYLATNTYTT